VINGATDSIYVASQSGNYSVEITNAEGCTNTSPAYYFSYDISIVNFSVNDSSFCEGSCLNFTDLSSNNPTSWVWTFPGGTPSSSTSQNPSGICYFNPGTYAVELTVTNLFGVSSLMQSSYITVVANPVSPVITQNLDTLFCPSAATSYQWYYDGNSINGATNDFYVSPQSGNYSVTITNAEGCTASSVVNVQIPAPMFIAQDTDICEKFCTDFIDESTNNPVNWSWIFEGGSPSTSSDQNPNICYNVPGTYDVTLITFNGIKYDTLFLPDYMTIFTTPPLPEITINGNTLTASSAYSYQWQFNYVSIPGATNQTYIAMQTGVYTLITSNTDGCSSQVSIEFNLVGVENLFAQEEISIHPNPGTGIFIVSFSRLEFQKAMLTVHDVIGKEISHQSISGFREEDNIILDLRSLNDGVYFIRFSDDDHFTTIKIIKQNAE
jgi:PKD repeat protein